VLRIANATSGLAFPPFDAVSMFLSTHGHNYQMGYFRIDAMPYHAVIELLQHRPIQLVDATPSGKELPDAFRFGVTTWCLVFNRALNYRIQVAPWQTREMIRVAYSSTHKKLVQRIRRLVAVYGHNGPAVVNRNVFFEIHRNFGGDDRPSAITSYYLAKEELW